MLHINKMRAEKSIKQPFDIRNTARNEILYSLVRAAKAGSPDFYLNCHNDLLWFIHINSKLVHDIPGHIKELRAQYSQKDLDDIIPNLHNFSWCTRFVLTHKTSVTQRSMTHHNSIYMNGTYETIRDLKTNKNHIIKLDKTYEGETAYFNARDVIEIWLPTIATKIYEMHNFLNLYSIDIRGLHKPYTEDPEAYALSVIDELYALTQ